MAENETQEISKAYEMAERRVAEKIGFFRHLTVYVVVNALLFAFNMIASSDFLWFLFPLGGWGIGLFAHFVNVFVFGGEKLERWRKKEIEKELQKLRKED